MFDIFLMISYMFDLGLIYFRGRAIVPETAHLQSPERLWTGCVGPGEHHRYVITCSCEILNNTLVFLGGYINMYVITRPCEILYNTLVFIGGYIDTYLDLQVMVHSAGTTSLTWARWNRC